MTHAEQETSQDTFRDAGSAWGENIQHDPNPAQVLKTITTHLFTVNATHLE